MGYLDGELSSEEKRRFKEHLRGCRECKEELKDFKRLKEVMESMKYKEPQDIVWQKYWSKIYNRLERGIGWILFSVGAIILLFYGGFKLIQGLIKDPTISLIVKIGALIFLLGVVILLVSIIRERVFRYKYDRYKEVKI